MSSTPPRYIPNKRFTDWLNAAPKRASYFSKVDPGLFPPTIAKMKTGHMAISFEHAIRLERAQMKTDDPLKAEELMTFVEHRELYRYVTGQDQAPAQIVPAKPKKKDPIYTDPRTQVDAQPSNQ